jgi:hypothetical protein
MIYYTADRSLLIQTRGVTLHKQGYKVAMTAAEKGMPRIYTCNVIDFKLTRHTKKHLEG